MSIAGIGPAMATTPRAGRTCTALNARGEPCRNWAGSNGLCSWHDPERTRKPMARRIAESRSRVCIACNHERPGRKFGAGATNPKTGEAYRRRTCLDCETKERRARGVPERHARYDARGHVWCNNCRQYLHADNFRRHPLRPHTYWSYCKECTRWIDRNRARSIRGTADWKKAVTDRVRRQRRQATQEQTERRKFVADAITLLGRRGLTRAEIARLCDTSHGSLIEWARSERRVTPQVASRFGGLLRLTHDFSMAAEPVRRRRLPHPEMPRLLAAMAPVLERYPVRNSWNSGKRRENAA